jgi:hypothetical protein
MIGGYILFAILLVAFLYWGKRVSEKNAAREARRGPAIGEVETKRPTFTRWLLLGPLSLAVQKRTRSKVYKP